MPGTPATEETPAIPSGSVSMWDSFQHILMFISLYVLAISVSVMLHYYIDKFMPGVASGSGIFATASNDYRYSLLKGETATMIVAYPVYAFLFLAVARRTMQQPQIRSLKSRKILIYLTLIITFIVVLTNVISLVYNFLGGNVTVNFLLHFLDTAGIASLIFAYYLHQVKEDRKAHA